MDSYQQYTLQTKQFYLDRRVGVADPNYHDRIAKYVGWSSQSNQYLGFEIATTFSGINWQDVNNILDVGCGYGNLVEYLRENKNFSGEYTGIDILPEFIQEATKIYGNDKRNKFIQGNFLTHNWREGYDVVVSLGIISVNYDQPNEYGEKSKYYANKSIDLMVKLAKMGMSLYFLNEANVPVSQKQINSNIAFYQPWEIQQMIENVADKRCESLTIESYPDINDVKTIAKVCFA